MQQPESWKQSWGFPQEVLALPEAPVQDDVAAWRHVILDRTEQVLAVLVLMPGPTGPRLLGFAARQEGWVLQAAEPILVLDDGWQLLFPELAGQPAAELARAWQTWALQHGLTEAEAASCRANWTGHRLRIQGPAPLEERARPAKGETWLLLGEGFVRTAAQLEWSPAEATGRK